jgi:hypothetical protein
MRVTITASIRLFFILTLVAISVVAQTGLISASALSPAEIRTTRVPGCAKDRSTPEESLRLANAFGAAGTRFACDSRAPEHHALTDRASK